MKNSNPNFNPVVIYPNPKTQKDLILEENRGKSGVYRWTNLVNGYIYIGSAVNLSIRLAHYYSDKYMETQLKKGKSAIYSSILKHGLSNYTLEILEYGEPSDAVLREQYYIDLLKPEYNILPIAGSSLGFKHSEEAKEKIRSYLHTDEARKKISEAKKGKNHPLFGKAHSEETRLKISEALKGKIEGKIPLLLGKTHSEETKTKMSEAHKGKTHSGETKTKISEAHKGKTHSVETKAKLSAALGTSLKVLDFETNETIIYASIKKAVEELGVPRSTLFYNFQKTNSFIFKGRYQIEKIKPIF